MTVTVTVCAFVCICENVYAFLRKCVYSIMLYAYSAYHMYLCMLCVGACALVSGALVIPSRTLPDYASETQTQDAHFVTLIIMLQRLRSKTLFCMMFLSLFIVALTKFDES